MKKYVMLLILLLCICVSGCRASEGNSTKAPTSAGATLTENDSDKDTTVSEPDATTTVKEAASTSEKMTETAGTSEEMTEAAGTSEETTEAAGTSEEMTEAESTSEETTEAVRNETVIVIEAEEAELYGGLTVENIDGFSGGKGVGRFSDSGQYIEFEINIAENGVYNLIFSAKGIGSDKDNDIYVDGNKTGYVKHLNEKLSDSTVASVTLGKGIHKVALKPSWGWIYLDKLTVKTAQGISDEIYNVSTELINPNASDEAKALYRFLCDIYGEKILSGQVCDYGVNGPEFKAIQAETGRLPAVLGLDMMRYSLARVAKGDKGDSVEVAMDFCNNQGGIVTYCWHWNAPNEYLKSGTDDNGNPRWWGGFYTANTDFDIEKVMNGSDPNGKALLDKDIEEIAKQLNRLDDAGVPVLWRPLHEASGGWFWWGAKGAEAYKKLWIYLYEQLTDVYGCDNLIWVYNGQSAEWYPGDDYVDIIGEDIYTDKRNYNPQTSKFAEAVGYTKQNKIVALTENGVLFDVDDAFAANSKWAWFNTWCGDFTVKNSKYNEEYTDKDMLKKVYGSDKVLTLDELPDYRNYK